MSESLQPKAGTLGTRFIVETKESNEILYVSYNGVSRSADLDKAKLFKSYGCAAAAAHRLNNKAVHAVVVEVIIKREFRR